MVHYEEHIRYGSDLTIWIVKNVEKSLDMKGDSNVHTETFIYNRHTEHDNEVITW